MAQLPGGQDEAHRIADRARTLAAFGADPTEVEELVAYNASPYDLARVPRPLRLPLATEPGVAVWEEYAEAAAAEGVFPVLARHLPQLRFPIRAGMSETEGYRAATRRGVSPDEIAEATGLELRSPERLQLAIHPSLAGRIPVLTTDDRDDFVTLVQALSMRNEPRPIPASMGASTVKGFNNWGRIAAYRRAWEAADPLNRLPGAWTAEFRQLIPRRELYEDSFILLCDGPYSNVAASELGMTTDEWRIVSLVVRAEHECTHYLTLRLFGTTRNNILDEVLADYTGIAMAGGRFKGEWLLRAVGLEDFPRYREGGRLQNYLGDPPLSPGAFVVLQRLVHAAAGHLEEFDGRFRDEDAGRRRDPLRRGVALLSAIQFTLEELAAPAAVGRLNAAADELTEAVQHVG